MSGTVKPVSFRSRTLFDRHKLWLLTVLMVTSYWCLRQRHLQVGAGALLVFCIIATYHFAGKRSQASLLGGLFGGSRSLSFTREGKCFIALVLVMWLVALTANVNLVFLILGLMISAIAISAVLSEISLWKLGLHWTLPGYAFAGQSFPVSVTLKNDKRLLPSISLSVEEGRERGAASPVPQGRSFVLMVPPGSQTSTHRRIRTYQRGVFQLNQVRVSTRFPFGFFEKSSTYESPHSIIIYPRLGYINQRVISKQTTYHQESGEHRLPRMGVDHFYGLREYHLGDNPKHIHWKSSARLNKPLVKEFEREEQRKVVLLVDSLLEDASQVDVFERALSFTATLTRNLAKEDYLVSLALASPRAQLLDAGAGPVRLNNIYRALALAEASSTPVVPELVNMVSAEVGRGLWLMVVLLDAKHFTHAARSQIRKLGNRLDVFDMSADADRLFTLE